MHDPDAIRDKYREAKMVEAENWSDVRKSLRSSDGQEILDLMVLGGDWYEELALVIGEHGFEPSKENMDKATRIANALLDEGL